MDRSEGLRTPGPADRNRANPEPQPAPLRILFLVCEDWLFVSFRVALAQALIDRGWTVAVGCRVAAHAAAIREAGVALFPVPFARARVSPLAALRASASIRRLIRQFRPDLVHVVALQAVFVSWLAMLGLRRFPVVNAVTGMGSLFAGVPGSWRLRTTRRVVERLLRRVFRRPGTCNVFQNQEDRDYFLSRGLSEPASTFLIRGSGVNVTRWQPRPEEAAAAPVILFVGRFLRDKGLAELLEASARLRSRQVTHRLRLVGCPDSSNPSSFSDAEVRTWQASGQVESLGWRSDVLEQMTRAQVIALPSYREGLPKVLLEAGVAERAVVTCDVIGCRELVQHEVNGLLVPPRDPEALAQALERLLRHPGLRRQLAERHRRVVCDGFSEELVISQYLAVYETALRSSRSASIAPSQPAA